MVGSAVVFIGLFGEIRQNLFVTTNKSIQLLRKNKIFEASRQNQF